jgi:hypothetical protein
MGQVEDLPLIIGSLTPDKLALNRFEEAGRAEGFGDVISSAQLRGSSGVFLLAGGGDHDDRDSGGGWLGFEGFEHLESGHTGHGDVAGDHVGSGLFNQTQCLGAASSLYDPVTGHFEHLRGEATNVDFVVDNENRGGHTFPCP